MHNNSGGGGVLQVKTVLTEDGNAVCHSLPIHYDYVLTEDATDEKGNQQCLTLRCSLDSMDQISSWLEAFQTRSHTRWIVGRCIAEPTRFIFRRQWLCHHSSQNKGKTQKSKSTNCTAKIDLKIKKLTCDTRKKDEFLRLMPPLPTIIKIYYRHNHTTEYVIKREQLLAQFIETKEEIKSEFCRLQGLIVKGKPGLSAMKQFLNQLKSIKTEGQLFESMRKVRLKPTVFTRIGRPPKNKHEIAQVRRELMQASTRRIKNKIPRHQNTSIETDSATLVAVDSDSIMADEQSIEFHTLEEDETEQATATIDVSFLFSQ